MNQKKKGVTKNRGNPKEIRIPKQDEKLAEFIGIVLGDGYIQSYRRGTKVSNHRVAIAGNSEKDAVYLKEYVTSLIKGLFGINPSFYQSKRVNCLYVIASSLNLTDFLAAMGLKPGKKIVNQTTIPMWVWKRKKYIRACLRGLYDTDGSLYELKPHWPGLFQLSFDNNNITLLQDVKKALDYLGIVSSKVYTGRLVISKKRRSNVYRERVVITKKEALHKFYIDIGTNNPRLKNKFSEFIAPSSSGQG